MLSPILACSSVPKAIEYYTQKLGFELAWSIPPNANGETDFAGVKIGDAEIMLGVIEGFVRREDLDKRGTGIQIYITLPEALPIEHLYATAKVNGADITRHLETREWCERAFTVNDLDGYDLMFVQHPAQMG